MVKRVRYSITALCMAVLIICCHMPASAQPETLTIGQVSVNKPEVTVYFDLPGAEEPGKLSATANLASEELTSVSLENFVSSGEGVWYILAVDLSTSMTAKQIEAIRTSIIDLSERMGESDRITLITFGLTVDMPLSLTGDKDDIANAATALRANQDGTLFNNVLVKVLELGTQYGGEIPERRVAFVFSDAEDYNVGGYVKEEVETKLEQAEFALYAFGFNNATRTELDSFGAMARLTGGAIDVVTNSTLASTVKARMDSINSGYIARFLTETNLISGDSETIALTVTSDGGEWKAEANITPTRWIPDHIPPQITSVEQTAPGTIWITFSKPMLGADKTTSFQLEDAAGDLLAVKAVSYNQATNTVMLTLAENPPSGVITISCPSVTDASMEKNPLTAFATLDFTGSELESEPGSELDSDPDVEPTPKLITPPATETSPAIWLFVSLAIALIVVGVTLGVIKSRGGLVRVDGKLRFAGKQEVFVTEEEVEAIQYQFVTAKAPELSLRIIDAAGNTRDISVPVRGSLFVGRAESNDLAFDDPRMSRQHFAIESKEDDFLIQNLSTSGTLMDGVPLSAPRLLRTGSRIEAGNITFIVL